jgi:membrane protease YdiL (CAAX protease family)
MNTPSVKSRAMVGGLCIALAGPPALSGPLVRLLGDPAAFATRVLGHVVLWSLCALVISIALWWEKQPLSSLGLRSPTSHSLVWGIITAATLIYLAAPAAVCLIEHFGSSTFEAVLSKLRAEPAWFLAFAGVTGGVVEETLYRGYSLERLSTVSEHRWLGALLPLLAFELAHIPSWGLVPALTALIPGFVLTVLYLWRRDLIANMVAHAVANVVLLVPLAG